ncbi:MAG TPA: serine kinase [Patescibacteria group bacterium]|nr:serine kinase [Patescibacteria group bacterium]
MRHPGNQEKADILTPPAFFESVYQAFQKAQVRGDGPVDHFYDIAGCSIRLSFASCALVPYITPAFTHLTAQANSKPDLTICLWDSASTNTEMPPPPWSGADYIPRGEIRGFNDEGMMTVVQQDSGIFNMLDMKRNMAVYWIQDAQQVPYYESGAPLLRIFHGWMAGCDRQLVHAGSVGLEEGGVLLAGRGGSGKSTVALSCIGSQLLYAGDDYVLLSHEHQPRAHSLFNTGKLDADNVWRFSHLKEMISNPDALDSQKALLFLSDYYPEKIIKDLPIKALLIPRITGKAKTTLARASQMEGVRALAPSTIFQLPNTGHATLQRIARLVKQVPCYFIDLGSDISDIPDTILNLLADEDLILD